LTSASDASRVAGSRRDRLLEHAVAEFAEKGLAGARVDEIARRAGVNKQLLYYYFENKRGLFEAAIEHMMELTRAATSTRSRASTRVGELLDVAGAMREPLGVRWRRLLVWEALESGADDIVREKHRLQVWSQRVADVQAAQAAGELDPDLDPELLSLALLAIQLLPYIVPQVTKMVTGGPPDSAKFERRQAAFLARLVKQLAPRRTGGAG
jgi:TetR/AcrR family transcriptional regulator